MKFGLRSSLIVAAMCAVLAGCSGGAASPGDYEPAPSAAASSSAASSMASSPVVYINEKDGIEFSGQKTATNGTGIARSTGAAPLPQARKIVRNVDLTVQTREFDTLLPQLMQIVEESGGYVSFKSVSGRNLNANSLEENPRFASISVRIPAERLDEVLNGVSSMCNVLERQENAEDITDSYFDAQARLKSLALQEERLLAILEKAEKLEDVVSLEKALAETRREIESITASLARMDGQVSFSTVNLQIYEVVDYSVPTALPKTFGEELSAAFTHSLRNTAAFGRGFAVFIVTNWPALLLLALVVFFALRFALRQHKRRLQAFAQMREAARAAGAAADVPEKQDTQDKHDQQDPPGGDSGYIPN